VPVSGLGGLKATLQNVVASGEYDTLFKNVLMAREALRYDNVDGAIGATPLIVAEMRMVLMNLRGHRAKS
jgi:hypothetical protein